MIPRRLAQALRRVPDSPDPPAPARPVALVGDIHGRADLLDRLLARLDPWVEMQAGPTDLVFLGDYVDRGPDSAAVLRRLSALSAAAPERVTCLAGNHEAMLLDALSGPPHALALWLRNGGTETLESFGLALPGREEPEDPGGGLAAFQAAARAAIGPELLGWIEALPRLWRSGDVIAVHAALDPALPPESQPEEVLLWGRPSEYGRPRGDGLWVVHGHTVTRPAEIVGRRIAIDTGAWFSETLTAVLLCPGQPPRFLDTG